MDPIDQGKHTPPTPSKPVPADHVLKEWAETLDVAALQQRHPDWTHQRLSALLVSAASQLGPDNRPPVREQLGALLPIVATLVAGQLLLLFGRQMGDVLAESNIPVPTLTRLALAMAQGGHNPVWILGTAMLAVYTTWAFFYRKRLQRFTSWAYVVAVSLGLTYLLACLYPLFDFWLHMDGFRSI